MTSSKLKTPTYRPTYFVFIRKYLERDSHPPENKFEGGVGWFIVAHCCSRLLLVAH